MSSKIRQHFSDQLTSFQEELGFNRYYATNAPYSRFHDKGLELGNDFLLDYARKTILGFLTSIYMGYNVAKEDFDHDPFIFLKEHPITREQHFNNGVNIMKKRTDYFTRNNAQGLKNPRRRELANIVLQDPLIQIATLGFLKSKLLDEKTTTGTIGNQVVDTLANAYTQLLYNLFDQILDNDSTNLKSLSPSDQILLTKVGDIMLKCNVLPICLEALEANLSSYF